MPQRIGTLGLVQARVVVLGLLIAGPTLSVGPSASGSPPPAPLAQSPGGAKGPRGAAAARQALTKLTTVASLMHTTAHPDDEHGGMLTRLSRGDGARVSLLSLTRGEAGDNAIGPELFDALGLIRTEELLAAGRYYGLDALYFSSAADYGYSKRLEEALDTWGREALVRDVVRAIRIERPLVIVSRFQGNARDGHGQHQAAGVVTREAFEAAGDPERFPEQIAAGLEPWRPRKLFIGGLQESEDWTVRIDEGAYSPVLGESFQTYARIGLSFQRSQNGGRFVPSFGSSYRYYQRIDAGANGSTRESGFFDGLDVGWSGVFAWDSQPAPRAARAGVGDVARNVAEALEAFEFDRPSLAVPALLRGLTTLRTARSALMGYPEALRLLAVKERQFMDAIAQCLALELDAVATQSGAGGQPVLPFAAPATMGPLVPGQQFHVLARLSNRSPVDVGPVEIQLRLPEDWRVSSASASAESLSHNATMTRAFTGVVATTARSSRPYFTRDSIAESFYAIQDEADRHKPFRDPVALVRARYRIGGVPVEMDVPVVRWESHLPYGYERRELTVVPALAVSVTPGQAIARLGTAGRLEIDVELVNNDPAGLRGDVTLELPQGWTSDPERQTFSFELAGERQSSTWIVRPDAVDERSYRIGAVATAGGREYREGYQVVEHRDLETRLLYREAAVRVEGIDVAIAPDLRVGYVMGIGDEVPQAIEQLGASVELLDDEQLATTDLSRFDAIMTGTRAYAVRRSLKTSGHRLMNYVEAGGNLIVLYNTPEFVPADDAPYPAELPRRSEEVSEQDSPVTILQPDHALLTRPNRIGPSDFDGWVEQRGSKFLASWDTRYEPLIETHDMGQEPQHGGWLTTTYGDGHYTYFAYALHRQVPYGVPGAYRLLANLLSLGVER